MTSPFSTRLRRLRLDAGMTQERLAERSGVSVRTIRGFETGERADPRIVTVRLLADALELEPDERDELLAAAAGRVVAAPDPAPVEEPPVDALTETADQLAHAVGARWRREEELRQIQDPFPLPVRWALASEDVTDHWANICRAPAGVLPEPLDLSGQLDQVVDVYRRIPSGRLVVLGRSGSGKTILTLRFVLDMLTTRGHGDAVPVIFSLGSWNPATTALRDWLTDHLVRDYPGLAASGPGGTTLAAALVEAGRILPVLDGFDEIARGLHRAALEALNATPMPLVLTSRPSEFTAAVAATDVLTSAAGVELTDLTLDDLVNYLPRTARKGTAWDPVLKQLRDHPGSTASAKVLTTPLMVSLARTIYSDNPGSDPADLLDTNRFGTPEAVEDHLLGTFIPTVYRHQPGVRRWDPDRVRRWLGYLAQHLHHLDTPDLAWWQLGNTMRRWSRMVVVGIVTGVVFGVAAAIVVALADWLGVGTAGGRGDGGLVNGLMAGPMDGLAAGLTLGLAHGVGLAFGGAAFEPSRVHIQFRGGKRRLRQHFVRRLMVGLAVGVGLAGGLWLAGSLGLVFWIVGQLGAGTAYGVLFGLVIGLVFGLAWGVMAKLEAPIDIRSAVSPTSLLKTNRTTAVFQSVVLGLVFALVYGIMAGVIHNPWYGLVNGLTYGLWIGTVGGLGIALSLTAWGQWVVFSRIWLPLTGRLPWAMIAFLDDACRRGVLRQSGAVYQFRHARLQDHLTHSKTASVPAPAKTKAKRAPTKPTRTPPEV